MLPLVIVLLQRQLQFNFLLGQILKFDFFLGQILNIAFQLCVVKQQTLILIPILSLDNLKIKLTEK